MTHKLTYIEAIGNGWPNVKVITSDDGEVYENIIHLEGDPIPPKESLDTYILDSTREKFWRWIQAERDRRKSGGILIDGYWYHTDDTSRIQYIGLLLMGSNMPPGIMWKTMSGQFQLMSPELALKIFQGIGVKDIAIFTIAEQHRALMSGSQTPETYNYLTGWPGVYGE